jgi:four helix bundle protein
MRDFHRLAVWQKSHPLVLAVYRHTESFPNGERYGLTAQIRRAATSIPTNIAEGCGRASSADFARFLQIAFGSACELEYQLLLAYDLGYLEEIVYRPLNSQLIEVKKMLTVLIQVVSGQTSVVSHQPSG